MTKTFRPTLGNVFGALLAGAAWVAGHSTAISDVIPPRISTPLLGLAAVVLYFSKGATTSNADAIPADKKVNLGPVVFEKTGPLK